MYQWFVWYNMVHSGTSPWHGFVSSRVSSSCRGRAAGIIATAMGKLTTRNNQDIQAEPKGNPDGKGLNGFLLDWYKTEPRGVVAKPDRQVMAEFFTSMLVLSAQFKYEPTIGVHNYLYFIRGDWQLSLIAPDEWNEERQLAFVGTCILQADQTWTIEPSGRLKESATIAEAIAGFFSAFDEMLDTDSTLEDILPFYVQHLPYYQRLHAAGLSRSIRSAVKLGDQQMRRARDWRLALPPPERMLALPQ